MKRREFRFPLRLLLFMPLLGPALVSACSPVAPSPHTAASAPQTKKARARSFKTPSRVKKATVSELSATRAEQEVPRWSCPEGMALVRRLTGIYCIDRYEASLVRVGVDGTKKAWPGNQKIDGLEKEMVAQSKAGVKPQGYISGEQAVAVCERAGKRLCEVDEWVTACRGSRRSVYPYGNLRKPKVCNDRYKKLTHHPVVRLFKKHASVNDDPKLMWHPSWMNDPRLHQMTHTVEPTGSKEMCTNEHEVFDMVGNLHEWVADPDGTFFGGFFMDTFQNGEGCEYRTIFHPFDYHDYSTGFRCCADPARVDSESQSTRSR